MEGTDDAATTCGGEPIRAVDLFCGAGGLSWGLVEALREVAVEADQPTDALLEDCIELVGVNHWERAIETHSANHPWATHFHDDVQNINPREVFDATDPEVTILSGGIECTHWSTARGGKPADEQKRMPAWDFLTWVQKLRPQNVLVENVPEFEKWGPIIDGTPTRNGETFEQWVDSLHALGYSVDWQVLNAANYGDATSRERLFVLARREHKPEFPDPTHTEAGAEDTDEWRTAADIIDWSDPGESIWSRSRPLVENTMKRIAEGIRRHGDDHLEPFADAVGQLGKADVEAMQERIVPAEYASVVAKVVDEPFLVAPPEGAVAADAPALAVPYIIGQHGGAMPRSVEAEPVPTVATDGYVRLFDPEPFVLPRNGYHRGLHSNPAYAPDDQPLHTVTAKNHDGWLVSPTLMQFSHGGKLLEPGAPLPTITTAKGGVFALSQSYLVPFYGERTGQSPRVRDVDRPLSTVPASKVPAGLASPYLIQYHGQSGSRDLQQPTPTLTARDSLALCIPDLYPWGLDVRFRMLQPRELAAAQGFPPEYEFTGTKTEVVEQIGNAVPVNLARTLVKSLLESNTPSLTDYLDDFGPRASTSDGTTASKGGATSDD